MSKTLKAWLSGSLKYSLLLGGFLYLQNEVTRVRHEFHGNTNGIAEAQTRQSRELSEARKLLHSAVEDSNLQVSQAQRSWEEITRAKIQNEKEQLEQLIDTHAKRIATSLKDRIDEERNLIEDARSRAETSAAMVQRLERAIEQDPEPLKRRMLYPTVQLRGNGTVGSGVLIYSEPQNLSGTGGGLSAASNVTTFVLTAHHVVLEVLGTKVAKGILEDIRILGENEVFDPEIHSGEVVISDQDRDVGLIRLRSNRHFPYIADLASPESLRRIDIFTRAYAVGCPLGNRPFPTVGEVSSKTKVVGDQVFWMLNAPTFFGNSGGGIYHASTCQLIGVSSMIYTYGKDTPTVVPHMGLFVPLESIYSWLESEGFSFVVRKEPIPPAILARLAGRREAAASEKAKGRPTGPGTSEKESGKKSSR